jgi:hypothetical protein
VDVGRFDGAFRFLERKARDAQVAHFRQLDVAVGEDEVGDAVAELAGLLRDLDGGRGGFGGAGGAGEQALAAVRVELERDEVVRRDAVFLAGKGREVGESEALFRAEHEVFVYRAAG